MSLDTRQAAYDYCAAFTQARVEHFPVASRFLNKKLRRFIAVIYTFARQADDIADEGVQSPQERLEQLEYYEGALARLAKSLDAADKPQQDESASENLRHDDRVHTHTLITHQPVFTALMGLFEAYPQLPHTLFFDLLHAFKQDVSKNRYANTQELLDYCRYSAHPIGRLLLYLNHQESDAHFAASDAICSSLQRINCVHDIYSDLLERNRCYMPLDALEAQGLSLDIIRHAPDHPQLLLFLQTQLTEIEESLAHGSVLAQLPGAFGFQIRLVLQSAWYMLQRLKNRKNLKKSIQLGAFAWALIFVRSLNT